MFKIKCVRRPEGILNNVIFNAPESINGGNYIIKHVEKNLYKVYSLDKPESIDINDGRGKYKEEIIFNNFIKGTWIRLEN